MTTIAELQSLRYSVAYSSQESTGISILVVVSLLSLLAVLVVLFAIALSAFNTRKSADRTLFVRTHGAAYFISLMLCWVIQCIGSVLNIQWLQDSGIQFGSLCIAQGVFKHIADVGIAVWTLVIAAHTFCLLFLELRMSKYVMWAVLTVGWLFITLTVASGPAFLDTKSRGPFYDVSGYWCWISPGYQLQRVVLGYMIMFLSALFSGILYILTFFRLRGNLVRDGWKVRVRRVGSNTSPEKYFANDRTKLAAKQMLLYPLTYALLIIPIAVVRFIVWSGIEVPFEWIVFSGSIYLLSGLVNVILFVTTRHILPHSSLRFGNWYFVPGSQPSTLQSSAEFVSSSTHSSEDSAEKGAARTVTFAADPTILETPPSRKDLKRPPVLDLSNRDSCSSMYSLREGVHAPALSSHWSPDTPPLLKSGRLSVCWQNMSSLANKV